MKYLIDTCVWIEWLTDSPLATTFKSYFNNPSHILVPTLVQYELYKWISRERNSTLALEVIGITETGMVVPLDTHLALSAAEFSKTYNLAMADAIVYATSQFYKIPLITADKYFKTLPDVKYFDK